LVGALCALVALAASAHGEWPMHRGNPQLNGRSEMPAPTEPKVAWTVNAGKPVKGAAAIAGKRVFFGDDDGGVHALDLATGKELWTFKTGSSIEATPLVLNGTVYIGSSDAFEYALSAEDGKLKWKYETGDKVLGGANWAKSPKGDATWILIGSYDTNLHCVDAATGKVVWQAQTDNYINGSPAVTKTGLIAFGGCDSNIHIVQLSDGKEYKQVETDAYIASSVAVDGTMGYVGNYGNQVFAFDFTTGQVKWRYRDRNFPYFSSAAVADDKILIGGRDKRLHCLKKDTGDEAWSFQTKGQVDSSPVICGDAVVVGSQDGRVYCVNLADGKERWSYEVGGAVTASPAVSDGLIVIGAEDGTVIALGELKK
jgi:outer membrane protein assembly factor BamB